MELFHFCLIPLMDLNLLNSICDMCILQDNKEMENREKNNLKEYVTKADPEVNKLLRKGEADVDGLFDGLFLYGKTPETLYRYLPNCNVNILDNIYCDKGYLSCSKDSSKFIGKVDASDLAVLIIKIPHKTCRIDVNEILDGCNDEGEFILPRETKLYEIRNSERFETEDGLTRFIDSVCPDERYRSLTDIYHIESITSYYLELREEMAKQGEYELKDNGM